MYFVLIVSTIERVHSHGQQLCKFIGTKETCSVRKRILVWNINMAAALLYWYINTADVTSCAVEMLYSASGLLSVVMP